MPASNNTLSKRRRFQSPITNYFPAITSESQSADGHALSHNHYSVPTFSATPVLPEKVQVSLAHVGMRVRKSVADGYKTQLSLQAEKAAAVTPESRFAQLYYGNTLRAELAPFSGLSKSTDGPNSVVTDDGDAFSLPSSSQESMVSVNSSSSALNGQKRAFGFEVDVHFDEDFGSETAQDFPRERVILSPRRRLVAEHSANSNMDLDDFEEASFLRQREEVDSDYVRMHCA